VDLVRFARSEVPHPALGTPKAPGPFTLAVFQLARRDSGGIETLHALPADVIVTRANGTSAQVLCMKPRRLATELFSSSPLPLLATLTQGKQTKAEPRYWLTAQGWRNYLDGRPLTEQEHLIGGDKLWAIDSRVGVGLDAETRSVAKGMLFTTQAVALKRDVGFLIGVNGADVPRSGTLRLGGDGRAASLQDATGFNLVEPAYREIASAGRCRVVLTTPGLFPGGWRLPGLDAQCSWQLGDVSGKLVAAAVPRAEIISGWDLASRQPKPAERVASTGSVYWLEDLIATPEALLKLVESGLWLSPEQDAARRAEGFNRFTFAAY
jgi:CRISPR-associated protein Cmr3